MPGYDVSAGTLDLVAHAALALASFTQGVFGFGFGIVAMGVLTHGHDVAWASGVVNLAAFAQSGVLLARLWGDVAWPVVRRLMPGVMVGLVVGTMALARLDRQVMVRLLGTTIVAIALWNLWDPRVRTRQTPVADFLAGAFGGALSGAFSTGGPPVVVHVYGRDDSPDALKATLQVIFLAMGVLRLPAALAQGVLDASMLWAAFVATPAVVGGALLGASVSHRIDPARFRRACWVLLGFLGVSLVITA